METFRSFTTPGTFNTNPGITSIRVRVVGAGGTGGAGAFAPPASPSSGQDGGGGGGGGYAHRVITSPSFPAPGSYAVTVGSAPGGTSLLVQYLQQEVLLEHQELLVQALLQAPLQIMEQEELVLVEM